MSIVPIMNNLFVFSIGVFIGVLFAFEISQKQLNKVLREWDSQ